MAEYTCQNGSSYTTAFKILATHTVKEIGNTCGPYSFGTQDFEAVTQDCFAEEDLREKARAWTEEWKGSDMNRRLTNFLYENAKSMALVDKILCFGAGMLRKGAGRGCR